MNVLGHMQQGASPSPFDRNMATKMGIKASQWISDQVKSNLSGDGTVNATGSESAALLGVVRRHYTFTSLSELKNQADFELRMPKEQWWLKLRPLLRILAKHDSTYEEERLYVREETS
ncbi:Phosphofructokinase [Popillia japonica]|uniref:Phosphofructokinase n=1 Tax=Popillia japonica TaxID=7064 RepID=A0AAW1MD37_POPJA